ncbi:DUF1775 domain-containing protein [Gordonia sp. HNM0687]|uniref:DUF1775 domain-containing protein n=1 Tax=Gordonia mangrovi TaxID=2665643 RepID=A0A6L7GWU7_9ACTN|nr:YcnI family protein [Gordonia mangrovi]MXP24400.1 DUF1775 domain-containing protein [Gordonia mangrovi]UVF76872.1 YcnI family protein [Gordonia mangrovi]
MTHRVLRRCAATVAAVALAATGMLVGVGAASAHVSASAPTLTQGGYGVVTFVVPNESDTAATTELTVTLPNLKSARPEVMSGWRSNVTTDPATEEVTSITWTALPGTPGVPVGEFAQFRISGGPFPEEETVMLPATQTYGDGETVDWTQPMGADGEEPEHPAPTVTLPAADPDAGHHGATTGSATDDSATTQAAAAQDSTDDAARWLGGIGLALGALGAVVGVAALTRSGRRTNRGGEKGNSDDNA